MSINSSKNKSAIERVANAKAYNSPTDFTRGYSLGISDAKELLAHEQLVLAKDIFACSGVKNRWDNLPDISKAKYLSDAAWIARRLGFVIEKEVKLHSNAN